MSRLPFLGYSKELPAKRDIFGDIRTRDQGLGIGTFSPIRLSEMKNDPVYNELYELGMYPSTPTRRIRNVELTPKEYEELLSLQQKLKTKERMKRVINTPGYKSLPQFRKKELLDDILKKSQRTARSIMFNKSKRLQKEYIELERKKFQQ